MGEKVMIKIYNTDLQNNKTAEINEFKKGSWINLVNPSDDEIKKVCENIKIQEDFIRYSLDIEEKARIDQEDDDNTVLFVVDVPTIEKDEDSTLYTTMPLGMIVVRDDFFITVSLRKNRVIEDFEKGKIKGFATYKKSRFILQILYSNASMFLTYLKLINKETESTEAKLKDAMKNKELLKMLSLEKSLVYFSTSLKSNEVVMEKTMKGRILKLYDEDEDLLEDAIIENKQAIEMGKIYSDILSGTMDTYASLISNNLNVVMKFLTSITLVIAVPTMISSFWGMNLDLPLEHSAWGFPVMVTLSLILTLLVTWWLKKKDMF